jgi:hypothetical protein
MKDTLMAEQQPDFIVLRTHRDLAGRRNEVWVRRGLLILLAAVPVLGLFNVFGQRPSTSTAATPAASLAVYAPDRLRGGLLYEARFHIRATRELKDARLVLDTGWLEGMQVNTIEPSPIGEASRDGKLSLSTSDTSPRVGQTCSSCSSRSTRRTSATAPATSPSTTASGSC